MGEPLTPDGDAAEYARLGARGMSKHVGPHFVGEFSGKALSRTCPECARAAVGEPRDHPTSNRPADMGPWTVAAPPVEQHCPDCAGGVYAHAGAVESARAAAPPVEPYFNDGTKVFPPDPVAGLREAVKALRRGENNQFDNGYDAALNAVLHLLDDREDGA